MTSRYTLQLFKLNDGKPLPEDQAVQIIDQFREESEKAAEAIDAEGNTAEADMHWLEADDELKSFSQKHPDVRFELQEDGFSWDGSNVTHFVNGNSQVCEGTMTYPPFDKTKLE